MFNKVLIANRGEIAVRLIQVCHELGAKAVVVYSQADAQSLAVSLADEALCVGPGPASRSYLNMQNIIEAAVLTGAEVIHPGFGFLAENADFSALCQEAGITFCGPDSLIIKSLGDKAAARALAQELEIPVIPGSGELRQCADALKAAAVIGYPVMLKAAAGGGGKGIRMVADANSLQSVFEAAQQEAFLAFGDDHMYVEKVLTHAKHLEVQVLADQAGHVWTFPERDCSLQQGKQKLIEISPCLALAEATRLQLQQAARRLAQAVHYQNAGTVEFLVADGQVYFMEMNTRIQVEHPVSECVTDVDLLAWQLQVACGESLPGGDQTLAAKGVAIECRLNALAGEAGPVTTLQWPLGGSGVRIDCGMVVGDRLSPYYDAMLAKVIVHAANAKQAWQRMSRVLAEIKIAGIQTNLAHQQGLVQTPLVQAGLADITYVEENANAQNPVSDFR